MKTRPFNLEEAKNGAVLCTACGRKARIADYNYCPNPGEARLLVIITYNNSIGESAIEYNLNGTPVHNLLFEMDLRIEVKEYEGWVNAYRYDGGEAYVGNGIYLTKEEAEAHATTGDNKEEYLGAFPFRWEE